MPKRDDLLLVSAIIESLKNIVVYTNKLKYDAFLESQINN
jgi:uncharacterized protein with HEPN domain